MELLREETPWRSALGIAGAYAAIGILWILSSDRIVDAVARSESQLTVLQTIKGTVFIVVSALVIFVLVGRALRELTDATGELEAALQQADRLHRILRHNLRNSCQMISGNVDLLAEGTLEERNERLATIRDQNDRLISLSRKSVYLHDFLNIDANYRSRNDLAATVQTQVERARENYPAATITVDSPDQAHVRAHHHIGEAVEELLENAVRHNDSTEPSVWVSVEKDPDMVTVTVADDGPGIPPVERVVLERKTETPTEHSQGLGLWLVYLTIHYSNGTLSVGDRDGGGAEIRFRVPSV